MSLKARIDIIVEYLIEPTRLSRSLVHFQIEGKKMKNLHLLSLSIVFLLLFTAPSHGDVYLIKPDGTGDFPNIQAAIDAAKGGDEILLANGVFKGLGNYNIDFKGKAITVRSQSGCPKDCTIDAEGSQWIPRRGFDFKTKEGADSIVRDLTITKGSTDDC